MLNIQMKNTKLSPGKKAKKIGIWAKIMTKWRLTYLSVGKSWQVVSFEGSKGGESYGIVDLLVIRRNCNYRIKPLNRGDLFEIILFQVRGSSSRKPTKDEIIRLSKVGKYYHTKNIILAEWRKGISHKFYQLENDDWKPLETKDLMDLLS